MLTDCPPDCTLTYRNDCNRRSFVPFCECTERVYELPADEVGLIYWILWTAQFLLRVFLVRTSKNSLVRTSCSERVPLLEHTPKFVKRYGLHISAICNLLLGKRSAITLQAFANRTQRLGKLHLKVFRPA